MLLLFLFIVVVVVCIVLYYGRNFANYNEATPLNKQRRLTQSSESAPIGKPIILKPESTKNGKRVTGAYIVMNANRLKRNREQIRNGTIMRSDKVRANAFVPGYNQVKGKNKYVPEKHIREIYWQRTHLLPFRYALDDGEIPYLLFAGTSHLNCGARPQYQYVVPKNDAHAGSVNQRKQYLNKMLQSGKRRMTSPKLPEQAGAPRGTHYSLDDIEQLADWILYRNPNNIFRYGVICQYDDPNEVIPYGVTAILYDLTHHQLVFSISLPNVF